MSQKATITRWGCKIVLAAMLLGCGLGCNPAGTTGGVVPATSKPNQQPDNKDKPGKQPKPDVGRSNPFGASPVRALRMIPAFKLAA
jgi:hypothetical protein